MTTHAAAELRARAHRLRRLAVDIEATPAMRLERFAGDETWRGSRPHLCLDLLRRNLAQLHRAADDLRWRAYLLEERAAACETVVVP